LRALGARTKKDWFERKNFRWQILALVQRPQNSSKYTRFAGAWRPNQKRLVRAQELPLASTSGVNTAARATPAKQVHFRARNALKTSLFSGVQRPQNKFIFGIVLRALGARTKKDWFERKNFRSQVLRA